MSLTNDDIARIKSATGNGCIPGCSGLGCGGGLGSVLVIYCIFIYPFQWIYDNFGVMGFIVLFLCIVLIVVSFLQKNNEHIKNNDNLSMTNKKRTYKKKVTKRKSNKNKNNKRRNN